MGQLHAQVWRQPNQLLAYNNDCNRRCGESQHLCQPGSKQLIDQDAAVLRIILEFHYVIVSIGTSHEMRLGTSAHSSDFLDRVQRVRGREGV
jgi:hypothetical protein